MESQTTNNCDVVKNQGKSNYLDECKYTKTKISFVCKFRNIRYFESLSINSNVAVDISISTNESDISIEHMRNNHSETTNMITQCGFHSSMS